MQLFLKMLKFTVSHEKKKEGGILGREIYKEIFFKTQNLTNHFLVFKNDNHLIQKQ